MPRAFHGVHGRHQHAFFEIPTMRRRDLEQYLLRRVEQDASFDGEVAWCYQEARHRDNSEGVLLHMLPQRLVDSTTRSCTAKGLVPKRYVPLTEIVAVDPPPAMLKSIASVPADAFAAWSASLKLQWLESQVPSSTSSLEFTV